MLFAFIITFINSIASCSDSGPRNRYLYLGTPRFNGERTFSINGFVSIPNQLQLIDNLDLQLIQTFDTTRGKIGQRFSA